MLLEKVNGISRVTRAWEGQTAVCIASGPSLTREQCEAVRAAGFKVAVVNDCYLMAPWADLCYFADPKWWKWHCEKPEFKAFAGQKCSITSNVSAISDPAVHVLKNAGPGDNNCGLSADPTKIVTGSHSGYQTLNIVVLSGAKRILLLGYDCKRGSGEQKHWFGNHPDGSEPPYKAVISRYSFAESGAKKLGIEIINCSPGSAIEAFKKMSLAEALNGEAGIFSDQTSAALPA